MLSNMSTRHGPRRPDRPLAEPHKHQPKYLVQCSNCHYQVKRNEILTLEPCKHEVCEDCLDREETDSQGEYFCPICVELNSETETPEPSHKYMDEDLESLSGNDRQSLNGKDRQSLMGEDQQSLDGKDRQSLKGEDQQSLDGKDRQSLKGEDQQSLNGNDQTKSLTDNDKESRKKYDQESLNERAEDLIDGKSQEPNKTSDPEPCATPSPSQDPSKQNDQEGSDHGEETSDITTSRAIYLTGVDEEDKDSKKSSKRQEERKDSKEAGWDPKPFCHRHYQDKVWYCLDCDAPWCKMCCRSNYHPHNHRLKSLGEVTKLLRSNAAQTRDAIQEKLIPVMRQTLQHEESYKKSLPKRLETLRELVEDQATSIVHLVEEFKARTIEDLEHYAFQTDKVMHKRLAIMNKQLQAAHDESQLLSNAEDASDDDIIKMHKRLQEFFVRSKEGNLSSFFLHNRSRPDFNVMATITSPYNEHVMPRELVEAVRRHVGWAIDYHPVLVNDTRHTQEYPLLQRGFRVPISQFPAQLSQTKKLIMEWRKFARMQ